VKRLARPLAGVARGVEAAGRTQAVLEIRAHIRIVRVAVRRSRRAGL
jgi:hypothetical protein